MKPAQEAGGLSVRGARGLEFGIIGFSILAIAMIFQPFSQTLFMIGCVGVVIGGLAFNLVPMCRPGVSPRALLKAAMMVLVIFAVVSGLALGSAFLYGLYLQP